MGSQAKHMILFDLYAKKSHFGANLVPEKNIAKEFQPHCIAFWKSDFRSRPIFEGGPKKGPRKKNGPQSKMGHERSGQRSKLSHYSGKKP